MKNSLIPWNWASRRLPLHRDDMNRLFDDFLKGGEFFPVIDEDLNRFIPKIDVKENDKEVLVSAELPGVSEKDVEVSLNNGNLILHGEKKEEKEEKVNGYYKMERSYGSFHRQIPLPAEIDKEKVTATFKDGVITVTLPKTANAQTEVKKVEIKRG